MRISNNRASYSVWSATKKNQVTLRNSMKRLASGLIQAFSAPAEVGISERMRSSIGGTDMAMNNVQSGLSMLSTSSGYLQNINDQLSRMKALSIQAHGVVSQQDKDSIQQEFSALQDEITRITSHESAAGKFNGIPLFQGEGQTLQVGADTEQTVDIENPNLEVSNDEVIGSYYTYDDNGDGEKHDVQWGDIINSITGIAVDSEEAIGSIDEAISYVSNAQASVGAQQVRLGHTFDGLLDYNSNLHEAESKIRDVDFARESTRFTSSSILSDIGTAMQAQANMMGDGVLALLS